MFLCFPQKFIKTSCSAKLVVLSQDTSGYTVWKPGSLYFKKIIIFGCTGSLLWGMDSLLLRVGFPSLGHVGAVLVGVFIAGDSLAAACGL